MVMGGDSCSKGREFESQHHLLDGHFFRFVCCKNCSVFGRTKINKKRPGLAHKKFCCNIERYKGIGSVSIHNQ